MRSWKGLLLVITVLLLIPASTFAAGWLIDVNGGVAIPTSDFGDFWKSGLLVGASASYLVSPQFAVGVNGAYVKNDPSDDFETILSSINADDEFKFIHYGAHVRYIISSSGGLTPYMLGGLGFYSLKESYSEPGLSEDFTQTAFGLRGGLGLNYMVGPRWGVAVEGNYHHVFTDEDEFGVDSAPFIGLTAGLHFHLSPAGAASTSGE